MKQYSRPRGFTLIELLVVLAIVAVLAALLATLLSSMLKAQRQALLRERQRTEFARLDALLRSEAHEATEVSLTSPTECKLTNAQGEQWSYSFQDEHFLRERRKGNDSLQRETFYLRPGMKVNFSVVQENGRSLLQLNLDLPAEANPGNARQTPYRGQMLVGGSLSPDQRETEKQP